VPVNFANLRHPKKDMLWVAAAGPLSNLAMALGWAVLAKLSLSVPESYYALPLALTGAAGVLVNIIFMVLNLMPLPPLDGGRMLVSLLPHRYAHKVAGMEPYGFPILLVLLFTGVLSFVLWPLVSAALWMFERGFSVPLIELIRIASTS
jgi:Zn-dependent protease